MLLLIDPTDPPDRPLFETATRQEEGLVNQLARVLEKVRMLDPGVADNVLDNLAEHLDAAEDWVDEELPDEEEDE